MATPTWNEFTSSTAANGTYMLTANYAITYMLTGNYYD